MWWNVDVSLSQNVCSELPDVPHAHISEESKKSEYEQGDVIYFTCETGYISGPAIKYECTNGGWLGRRRGTCYLKPCGLPDNTPNGYYQIIHGEDFVFGATVKYFCDEGYQMVSKQDTRTCVLDGWTHHMPVCEPSSCELPPAESGVTVTGLPENDDPILPDRFLTFSCDEPGKRLNGTSLLICGKDGEWSSPFPSCEDITCKAEAVGIHININGLPSANETMKIGHKLRFGCDQGFLLEGSEEVECLQSGQWNKPFPVCKKGCRLPLTSGFLINPALIRKLQPPGSKIIFSCPAGKFVQGKAEVECLANGEWSDPFPTCGEPLGCGKPPDLPDGDTKTSIKFRNNHNDRVEYVCQRDYVLEGPSHKTCRNGEWVGEMRCLKPCTVDAELMRQHNIEFKHRDTSKLYAPHNDVLEFRCTWGHRHVSTVSMRQWCNNGVMHLPTCQ
ncbi:hypothetical protein LDENG_00161560 [Lucifuga dentata]|nr:hypothetical protein LDENG_00161560 [Lucifuga dentata]